MTLEELYHAFCKDRRWGNMASQSARAMVSVFLRDLGHTACHDITADALQARLAQCPQPELRIKAQACMHYLAKWAAARRDSITIPLLPHPADKPAIPPPPPPPAPEDDLLDINKTGPKVRGFIYKSHYSKTLADGTLRTYDRWIAEISIRGQRLRHTNISRRKCERWLARVKEDVRQGRI